MEEYKKISAELYEYTKPVGKSLDGDLEYYYNLIKNVDGKILEAGVGTGRLLIPYLKKGLDIDGVDLSEDMLNICRDNLKRNNLKADLYLQNLINLDIDKKYGAIIIPTGSFCLIDNYDDMEEVLKKFYLNLEDNGFIALDIIYPSGFENVEYNEEFKLDDEKSIVYGSENIKIDYIEQKTYSINRYKKYIKGELVGEEEANFNLKWYGILEFKYILGKLGYENISYTIDYGKDGNRDLVTFIAYKTN